MSGGRKNRNISDVLNKMPKIPEKKNDETNSTETIENTSSDAYETRQAANKAHNEFLRAADKAISAEGDAIYKKYQIRIETAIDMYGIIRGLDDKDTKKYTGTHFGYSSDQKKTAIDNLRNLLKGKGDVTKNDIKVLRDGELGKSLRNVAIELGKELRGESSKEDPYTVRDLIEYLQRQANNRAEETKTPKKE